MSYRHMTAGMSYILTHKAYMLSGVWQALMPFWRRRRRTGRKNGRRRKRVKSVKEQEQKRKRTIRRWKN